LHWLQNEPARSGATRSTSKKQRRVDVPAKKKSKSKAESDRMVQDDLHIRRKRDFQQK
jgi:hypothetical protein